MKRKWTDEDIKILTQMYKTHTVKDISKHFNVSESNIRCIASTNGIKRAKPKKRKINLCELLGFDEYTYG